MASAPRCAERRGDMRFIVSALLCAGVLAALAGCDPTDKHYFTQGVGTRLSSDDIAAEAKQTDLQNAYVAEICRQAGLQPTSPAEGIVTCLGPDQLTTWTLFVQAGMNDIDQRCDAYLTWLDEFKRSRDPILNQISNTGTTTQNIMLAAGVHSVPITIVADAFGLARNTFSNVSTRLLIELPHSTIQAVVLGKQKQLRDEVFGTPGERPVIAVTSRPAAIYVLRSYLRLCMPMTIETEVNNTVATIARSGNDAVSEPLITASNVGVARITNVTAPIPAGPKAPAPLPDRNGAFEIPLTVRTVKAYQNALCISPDDGKLGPQTRVAISEFLKLRGEKDTSAQFDRRTPGLLQDAVDTVRNCRGKFLMNVYEVVNYGMPANRVAAVKSLQDELNKALKKAGSTTAVQITGQFTDDSQGKDPTRNAIAEMRKLMSPSDAAAQNMRDPKNRQVDANFDAAIAP